MEFIIVSLIVISLLLPWINFIRISLLAKKLEQQVDRDEPSFEKAPADVAPAPVVAPSEPMPSQAAEGTSEGTCEDTWGPSVASKQPSRVSQTSKRAAPKFDWDISIAPKLPVWIGSVAFIFAGFYMMKYSIEQDLLSPNVRVLMGYVFGICLLVTALYIEDQDDFANGKRIAQALLGSAFAIFYGGSYVASAHYGLVPSSVGFIAMFVVTLVAAVFALKFGEPIAMVALLGGMITPALFKSDQASLLNLFIYLYFIVSGIAAIAHRKRWWWLIVFAIVCLLGWLLFIVSLLLTADLVLYFLIFVVLCFVTLSFASQRALSEYMDTSSLSVKLVTASNVLTAFIVLGLISYVMDRFGMGLGEWSLLFAMIVSLLFMAYYQEALYRLPLCGALATVVVLLSQWDYPAVEIYLGVAGAMSLLPVVLMHQHVFKSTRPVFWGLVMMSMLVSSFLVVYFSLSRETDIRIIASLAALVFSGAVFAYTMLVQHRYQNPLYKEALLGIFVFASGALFALGLGLYLSPEFLAMAVAFESCLAYALSRVTRIARFSQLGHWLVIAFLVVMLPEWNGVFSFLMIRVFNDTHSVHYVPELMRTPWLQLGLPILFFGTSLYLMRREQQCIPILAKTLFFLTLLFGYFLIHFAFHLGEDLFEVRETLWQSLFVTVLCYALAWGGSYLYHSVKWDSVQRAAIFFFMTATLRVFYFDCFLHLPLWQLVPVYGWFIFNSLALMYVLPVACAMLLYRKLFIDGFCQYERITLWIYAAIGLCYISLVTRHLLHGSLLWSTGTDNLEIYGYTLSWLLYALLLLFVGALYRLRDCRYIAVLIVAISVAKVFFIDSAQLEGLYRVFSFLCLGIVLIGMSYFYSRFLSQHLSE